MSKEAVEEALEKKGWSWTQLRAEVKKLSGPDGNSLSWSTMAKMRAQEPVDHYIVSRVANALGVPPQSLLLDEKGIIKLASKDFKQWSAENWMDFQRQLIEAGLPPAKLKLLSTEEGCVKLTVEMTGEQAEVLKRLFDEGKLAPLGVSNVTVKSRGRFERLAAIAKAALDLIAERFFGTTGRASLAASALSLLCSFSTFLPVWRVPYFAVGIAFGMTGGVMGRKRWSLLVAAGVATLANFAGWGVYVLTNQGGAEGKFEEVDAGVRLDSAGPSVRVFIQIEKNQVGRLQPTDRLKVLLDGKECANWEGAMGLQQATGSIGTSFEITKGDHLLQVLWNGREVANKNIKCTGGLVPWRMIKLIVTPTAAKLTLENRAYSVVVKMPAATAASIRERRGKLGLQVGELADINEQTMNDGVFSERDYITSFAPPIPHGARRITLRLENSVVFSQPVNLPPLPDITDVSLIEAKGDFLLLDLTNKATATILVESPLPLH